MNGSDITAIRKRAGLTIVALAALLRVADRRTVRRWEKGEVPVTGPASIVLELLDTGELPARYRDPQGALEEREALELERADWHTYAAEARACGEEVVPFDEWRGALDPRLAAEERARARE